MTAMQYINITAEILCLIVCLILLLCVITAEYRNEKLNRIFIYVVGIHIPLLLVDTAIFVLMGRDGRINNFLFRTAYCLSFVLGSTLLILFTRYLLAFIGIKTKVSKNVINLSKTAIAVCFANIICVIITQFNGMYYILDGNNIFIVGDGYWLSQFSAVICIALNTVIIIAYRKWFNARELIFLLSYAVLPIIALLTQNMVDVTIASIDVATTLTILIFYAGIQSEQAKLLKQKELELVSSRIDIMLSQIQPHFLYNTLNTIENLCNKNGEQAAVLVRNFSNYLRDNMDSLKQRELVLFDRELEHIKIYLEIEKLRFEERLNVAFNFETTDFCLPILTVQPLVENAVRHGVTKKLAGGTVTISTHQEPEHIKIIISDDGVGFDTVQPNQGGRSHVGIENVRNRLDAQCGGTLTIKSVKGVGTTSTIIIPQRQQAHE